MFIAIGAVAAVALAILVLREVRRNKQTGSVREGMEGQPIRFQTPVHFKRDSAPDWALGAAGFSLVVRPGSIAVIGPGESQSWYFSAPESSVECSQGKRKDWIVITGTDSGSLVRLCISPTDRNCLWEAWSALVGEGAAPLSDPPLPG